MSVSPTGTIALAIDRLHRLLDADAEFGSWLGAGSVYEWALNETGSSQPFVLIADGDTEVEDLPVGVETRIPNQWNLIVHAGVLVPVEHQNSAMDASRYVDNQSRQLWKILERLNGSDIDDIRFEYRIIELQKFDWDNRAEQPGTNRWERASWWWSLPLGRDISGAGE